MVRYQTWSVVSHQKLLKHKTSWLVIAESTVFEFLNISYFRPNPLQYFLVPDIEVENGGEEEELDDEEDENAEEESGDGGEEEDVEDEDDEK